MKHIIRQPIRSEIESQLQAKQQRVNSGEKNHRWWSLNASEKQEVRKKLIQSQGALCCYCECRIENGNIHIEHFEERHDNPQRVYDYFNMLLSCEGDTTAHLPSTASSGYKKAKQMKKANTTCGHKKSKPYHNEAEIDYNLLLNPVNANTHKLFSYIDGFIEPAKHCNRIEKEQAEYTKKRLALDSDKLNQRRILRITEIQNQINQLNKEETKQYILSLTNLSGINHTPYYSTIKDNFEFLTK